MSQRWSNKKDVLKDLEVVSGHQVDDVEDGYFLYGEQPPPPRLIDEDNEIELLFGREASQRLSQGNETEPDLIGITKMLRMVQQYENLSDEELPVTPDANIVIRKPNGFQVPSPHESCLNIKDEGTFISPNKSVVTGNINLSITQPNEVIARSSNERESRDNVVTNSKLNASNRGASGDSISSNKNLVSSNSSLLVNPVKIVTNDGIVISKLNPCVKEFIPKNAQLTSSQGNKSKEENMNGSLWTDTQNNETDVPMNNKTLEDKIQKSETIKDATAVKAWDSSEEMKKEMAMMLKNQISTKNDTFEDKQQTNRAIVNLLKLYAQPTSAKPLKLLTPAFFEKSKTNNFKDIDSNKTDHSIEKMTSLHDVSIAREVTVDTATYKPPFLIDSSGASECSIEQMASLHKVKEVNADVTPYSPIGKFGDNSQIEPGRDSHKIGMSGAQEERPLLSGRWDDDDNVKIDNIDITPYILRSPIAESEEAISETFGWSENSDRKTNDTLFKKGDDKTKNYNDVFTSNDVKGKTLIFKEDNSHAFFGKNNDIEKFNENTIDKINNDAEEDNEIESTQLTPDMGGISIDEPNISSGKETIDPYVKESISKVNNWLNDKPVVTISSKPKNPVLHLGPVAYKRKDPVTCKSPSEVTEKKVSKAAEYKPSSYAQELHKKYSERNKINNPAPILNIWEKLEADLKKKDLEIRSRKKKA